MTAYYSLEMAFDIQLFGVSPVARLKNQLHAFSSTSSARSDVILRLLKMMFIGPIITLVRRMICTWLQAPRIAVILNNWANLEPKFAQQFRNNVQFKAGKTARKCWRIWWILVGFLGLVFVRQLTESLDKEHANNHSWADAVGHWVFNIDRVINSYVLGIVEDFMVLCLFKSVTTALRMIANGMNQESKCLRIQAQKIKVWRRLILEVQDQCELICKCIRMSQLMTIFECISFCTFCTYAVVILPWQERRQFFTYVSQWFIYVCFSLARLYLKAWTAEKVGEAGHQVTTALMGLPVRPEDLEAQLQVKLTQSALLLRPIRIHLGTVRLNRHIILAVFNSVVTYLIVLLQLIQK